MDSYTGVLLPSSVTYYNPEGKEKSICESILFGTVELEVHSPCNRYLRYKGISMVEQYKIIYFFQQTGESGKF